jgi:hypothetical protein
MARLMVSKKKKTVRAKWEGGKTTVRRVSMEGIAI